MKKSLSLLFVCFFVLVPELDAQWVRSGLDFKNIYGLCIHNNHLYAASSSEGVFHSTDNGATWIQNNISNPNPIPMWIISTGSSLLTGGSEGLNRSTDNGNTWTKINTHQVYSCCKSGSTIFAAVFGLGVEISNNDGVTWINKSNGVDNSSQRILASGTNVFLGTSSSGFYISTNNGDSWTLKNTGLPNANIYPMYAKDQIIWVSSWNKGIFRSTDFGNTWVQIGANFGQWLYITEYQNHLFLWGDPIYRFSVSKDNGNTWTLSNTGLNPQNGYIYGCAITGNNIFLATSDGIWKRPLSELITDVSSENSIPLNYSLDQNYPNPFNPSTTIRFSIPEAGFVTLKLYDLLGKEVATLVNEFKQPGTYDSQFSIFNSQLASGVYLYKLQTKNFTSIKKLLLLK